jgi:hypothetical protein
MEGVVEQGWVTPCKLGLGSTSDLLHERAQLLGDPIHDHTVRARHFRVSSRGVVLSTQHSEHVL